LLAEHWNESISQDATQAFCAILRRVGADTGIAREVRDFFPKLNIVAQPSRLPSTGKMPVPLSHSDVSSSALAAAVSWPYSLAADRLMQQLACNADTDARARLALVFLSSARADWAPARPALVRGLRAQTDVRAVGAFLTALLEHRASLEWCYLAAARYIELADKAPAARVHRDLERAILACAGPPTYPIQHWLFQEWHKKKFVLNRTLTEKERVADEYVGLRTPRKMSPRTQAWFDRIRNKNRKETE